MDHSYEELRDAVLDLLAGREKSTHDLNQYANLALGVAELFRRRERTDRERGRAIDRQEQLSPADRELFLEVFWGLFREGVITLGYNDCNRNFPFCRVSHFGRRLLEGGKAYFFYDVSSYTKVLLKEVPQLHDVTLLYLQEAMQSFRSGCMLAASVMLGVATEHTFLRTESLLCSGD